MQTASETASDALTEISPAKRLRASPSEYKGSAPVRLSGPHSNGGITPSSSLSGLDDNSTNTRAETPTTPQTESTMLAMRSLTTAGTPVPSTTVSAQHAPHAATDTAAAAAAVGKAMPESTLPSAADLTEALAVQQKHAMKAKRLPNDSSNLNIGSSGLATTATTSNGSETNANVTNREVEVES